MLKRLLWIFGGALGIVSVVSIVIWRQATYLPSWYEPTPIKSASEDTTPKELTREEIWRKVSDTLKQQSSTGERVGTTHYPRTRVSTNVGSRRENTGKHNFNSRYRDGMVGAG